MAARATADQTPTTRPYSAQGMTPENLITDMSWCVENLGHRIVTAMVGAGVPPAALHVRYLTRGGLQDMAEYLCRAESYFDELCRALHTLPLARRRTAIQARWRQSETQAALAWARTRKGRAYMQTAMRQHRPARRFRPALRAALAVQGYRARGRS